MNRAILTGFSTLYQELVEKEHLVPVTDPDFEPVAYTHLDVYKRQVLYHGCCCIRSNGHHDLFGDEVNFPNKNFGGGTVIFFLSFILKFF